jgi:hypothetical protein
MYPIVEKMPDAREMNSANIWKFSIDGPRSSERLEGDHAEGSFDLFANGVRSRCAMPPPPTLQLPNVPGGEIADLNRQR